MDFESVHNYYDILVFKEIQKTLKERKLDINDVDYAEDIACVALNHLPPRYVRHEVDLIFYLTDEERRKINISVKTAVADAFDFVETHRR